MDTSATLAFKAPARTAGWRENKFLAQLPAPERERLLPDLQETDVAAGSILLKAGEAATRVIFPINCVISISSAPVDGVDVALVGSEGLLIPSPTGSSPSMFNALVQLPGRVAVGRRAGVRGLVRGQSRSPSPATAPAIRALVPVTAGRGLQRRPRRRKAALPLVAAILRAHAHWHASGHPGNAGEHARRPADHGDSRRPPVAQQGRVAPATRPHRARELVPARTVGLRLSPVDRGGLRGHHVDTGRASSLRRRNSFWSRRSKPTDGRVKPGCTHRQQPGCRRSSARFRAQVMVRA